MPSLPAGCLSKPITASTVSDPFLLISYDTAEQFDLCLSNEVLKANLKPLLEQPLTVEYLRVMKKKLEQVMGDTGQDPPTQPPVSVGTPQDRRDPLQEWASPATGMNAPERVLCAHFCLIFPSLTLFSAPLTWPYRFILRRSRRSS